jgi:hypothetical protein
LGPSSVGWGCPEFPEVSLRGYKNGDNRKLIESSEVGIFIELPITLRALAAEAIAAYVDSEEWQFGEVQAGLAELDREQEVSHEKVAKWLSSWGKPSETKAPR